ncbi:tetratricopeptide repeat protein, partial [bacterium]|nr:tetratricopeptide repeat protein [bacterium]
MATTTTQDTVKAVLDSLTVRGVLEFLDYRTDTIQETDKALRCFCPIHKEQVFRTLSIDKLTKKGKCSYTPCPGRKSLDLIKLVAMVKDLDPDEALVELVRHFHLDVEVPGVDELLEKRLETAVEAVESGDLDKAYAAFQHVLSLQEENRTALEGLVEICNQQGNIEEVGSLQKRLARLYVSLEEEGKAAEIYRRFLEHSPEDVEIRLRLAECFHRQGDQEAMINEMVGVARQFENVGDADKALEIYHQIDSMTPESTDITDAMVDLLVKVGRADDAIEQIAARARKAVKNGDLEQALQGFQQILDIDPQRDDFRVEIVRAILGATEDQDPDRAVSQCLELVDGFAGQDAGLILETVERVRDRWPGNLTTLERLYKLYRDLGRDEQAVSLRGELATAYIHAAQDYSREESASAAYQAYSRAAELEPDNPGAAAGMLRICRELGQDDLLPELQKRLAGLYTRLERFEEAIPIYEQYLEANPDDLDSRLQLAQCLYSAGRGDEMLQEMKNVAGAFVESGQTDQAIDIYRRISAFDLDDPQIDSAVVGLLVQTGRIDEAIDHVSDQADRHREAGEAEQALACYRQILELNPKQDDIRLKHLQTLVTNPQINPEILREGLGLIEGFVHAEWGDLALQILEDLRARFPGNPDILKEIYRVYRQSGRDHDADALAFDLAQNFLETEEHDQALEWVEPLIEQGGPGKPIALSFKASIYRAKGDSQKAVSTLMQIIDEHESRDQIEEALPFYESVLEIEPEDLHLQHRYLKALAGLDMTDELVEAGTSILPLLNETEKTDLSLEMLRALVDKAPLHCELLMAMASVLSRVGRNDEARRALLQAADLLSTKEEPHKAIDILQHLVELDPHDLSVIEKLADFRLKAGQDQKALEAYESLADLYGEQGSPDAQLDMLLKISEIKPKDTQVLREILVLYEQLENTRDARELREKMIRIYIARKQWDDALELCRESLKSDPHEISVLESAIRIHEATEHYGDYRNDALLLLEAYRASGDVDNAGRLAGRLADRFPEDRQVLEQRLLTLCDLPDWKTALEVFDQLVPLHNQANSSESALALAREMLRRADAPAEDLLPRWIDLCRHTASHCENWEDTAHLLDAVVEGKHTDRAADLLGLILRDAPEFEPARVRRIELLEAAGKPAAAVRDLREWAELLRRKGSIHIAAERYDHALRLAPNDLELMTEAMRFRAEAGMRDGTADLALAVSLGLERKGLVAQAIVTLETGLAVEPTRDDLRQRALQLEDQLASPDQMRDRYLRTCDTQIERGDLESADATLIEGLVRFPGDIEMRCRRSELLKNLDRREEFLSELGNIATVQAEHNDLTAALKTLSKIQNLAPDDPQVGALQEQIESRMGEQQNVLLALRRLSESGGSVTAGQIAELLSPGGNGAAQSYEMLPILKEYTFGNFIVGSRNNFAYATSMAVAKTPGSDYNPLFVYGDVGLGKTHLLHAIANELMGQGKRVLYTSSEEFTNALIEAIQNNTVRQFRALHKSPDVFLIDDIHCLADKERAQEEFFQIFNALYQANKQIVMTSDRPPKEIGHLERRLRSRFSAGIIVDIQPPDLETRLAILRNQMGQSEIDLKDDILEAIAHLVESNIRDLKSVLV